MPHSQLNGHAYIYLKTLLKSKKFQARIRKIRKIHNIKLRPPNPGKATQESLMQLSELENQRSAEYDKGGPKEKTLKGIKKLVTKNAEYLKSQVRWLEGQLDPPDLSKDPEFLDLCKWYILPRKLRPDINNYIWTGKREKLFGNEIKTFFTNNPAGLPSLSEFSTPQIVAYLPLEIEQKEIAQVWNKIQESKKIANFKYLKGVHIWKIEETFEDAIVAYHLREKGEKGEKFFEKLRKATKNESYQIGQSSIYNLVKAIKEQTDSLQ